MIQSRIQAALSSLPRGADVTTMTFRARLSGCEDLPYLEASKFEQGAVSTFARCAVDLRSTGALEKAKIKVFPKGSVHVTGCKSESDAVAAAGVAADAVRRAYPSLAGKIGVERVDLVMINVRTSVELPEGSLADLARACEQLGVEAEIPERPPSCLVRCDDATAMVYKSGKIIVSARTPEAVARAFLIVRRAREKLR